MSLSSSHIKILQLLHDSENHGIKSDDLVKYQIEIENFSDLLEELVKEDLVEYEINENTYYLAYDGFTALEEFEVQKKSNQNQERPPIDFYKELVDSYGGSKSLNRQILGTILVFGILATIYFAVFPDRDFTKKKDGIEQQINESDFQNIKGEIEHIQDSIQKLE